MAEAACKERSHDGQDEHHPSRGGHWNDERQVQRGGGCRARKWLCSLAHRRRSGGDLCRKYCNVENRVAREAVRLDRGHPPCWIHHRPGLLLPDLEARVVAVDRLAVLDGTSAGCIRLRREGYLDRHRRAESGAGWREVHSLRHQSHHLRCRACFRAKVRIVCQPKACGPAGVGGVRRWV